jgi:hypothetical protein
VCKTALGSLLLLLAALSCDDRGHAPHGAGTGLPPGGSDLPPDTDGSGDSDSDSDTDSDGDGGTAACDEDEVLEPIHNRCWPRCPLGQQWNDGLCTGVATLEDWEGAVAGCSLLGNGLHVATRQEMVELLGGCDDSVSQQLDGYCNPCGASDTCELMFGVDLLTYWTSTSGSLAPWIAGFDSGLIMMAETELDLYHARCVRNAG